MNKNSNKQPLQFTELTPDDVSTYEDLYMGLLVGGAVNIIPNSYIPSYYGYAEKELEKAKELFQKTFGQTKN